MKSAIVSPQSIAMRLWRAFVYVRWQVPTAVMLGALLLVFVPRDAQSRAESLLFAKADAFVGVVSSSVVPYLELDELEATLFDQQSLREDLRVWASSDPDIVYVEVRDGDGHLRAHYSSGDYEPSRSPFMGASEEELRMIPGPESLHFSRSILNSLGNHTGHLQVGYANRTPQRESVRARYLVGGVCLAFFFLLITSRRKVS